MTQKETNKIELNELEKLLREANIWLGTNSTSRRTEEARVKEYLDSENYAASVVESGFAEHTFSTTIADDHETVYLIHKPTKKAKMVDRDLVKTTSITKPGYNLNGLEENQDYITLSYRQGDNQIEKKFKTYTENKIVQENKLEELQ